MAGKMDPGVSLHAYTCKLKNAAVCGVDDPSHVEYHIQPRVVTSNGETTTYPCMKLLLYNGKPVTIPKHYKILTAIS
ncbi:hypothetical protein GGF41_005019 [Coemansia sp. RSA 2531]|nr:hypothetical protein GGF41_005019 [Coemansia sp. RSA 2531]